MAQTFWNLKKNINNNKVFDRIINCSVIKGCKTNAVLIETKTSSPMSDRYSAFMTEDGKSNLRSFEPKIVVQLFEFTRIISVIALSMTG